MRFDFFESVKTSRGEVCSQERFITATHDGELAKTLAKIAKETDHDRQNILKKDLPVICWMASYGGQARKIANAIPSGLVMVDIDDIESPDDVWRQIESRGIKELGIAFAHKTPSTHGVRVVFKNRPEFTTIEENQSWFASQFPNLEFDACVKDLARASYLVSGSYFYYQDMGVFEENFPVYINSLPLTAYGLQDKEQGEVEAALAGQGLGEYMRFDKRWFEVAKQTDLFGKAGEVFTDDDFKDGDVDLRQVVLKWFDQNGGWPQNKHRNTTLFKLCCQLRYICEFSSDLMLACIPVILSREETCSIISNALKRERTVEMPAGIKDALNALRNEKYEDENGNEDNIFNHLQRPYDMVPANALPPIFKEFVQIAPNDFKKASVVALLPMLGTLGSRLRAVYLDGQPQSPSFQCEIEAPMASGKSFVTNIFNVVMKEVMEQDAKYREQEAEYEEKLRRAKNQKEQPAKETYPVRILGAKVSIGALLDRLAAAQGLHVITFTDEVRNVLDSMGAGKFGDIRALLRNAFDNAYFGQDYKSDTSSKRMVRVFYNTLHCGTPAEYRKFYNNAEDGTITRVLFAELPDQAFKDMPIFKQLGFSQDKKICEAVKRLSDASVIEGKVQPELYLKEFGFMNDWAAQWLKKTQRLAIRFDNRSLDTYRRRAAVVGFRSAMLAWFLWNRTDELTRQRVKDFATMIAETMVVSLMQRYSVSEVSNVIWFKNVWNRLEDTFTFGEVKKLCDELHVPSEAKVIIYRWKQKNLIETVEKEKYCKISQKRK